MSDTGREKTEGSEQQDDLSLEELEAVSGGVRLIKRKTAAKKSTIPSPCPLNQSFPSPCPLNQSYPSPCPLNEICPAPCPLNPEKSGA